MSIEDSDQVSLKRMDSNEQFEVYTSERIAEFLLGSATDEASYKDAEADVRGMGLDPGTIDHFKPDISSQ